MKEKQKHSVLNLRMGRTGCTWNQEKIVCAMNSFVMLVLQMLNVTQTPLCKMAFFPPNCLLVIACPHLLSDSACSHTF